MSNISRLVSIIRDFINGRRRLHTLIQVRPDWNRLTSSLDGIVNLLSSRQV